MVATPGTAPGSLLHIARAEELAACVAEDDYAPEAFSTEGFIHCCWPEQLAGVLERHFDDLADLVLLELDPAALPSAPVEEDTADRGECFPHLYARIAWSAMLHRRPLASVDAAREWLAAIEPDSGSPRRTDGDHEPQRRNPA